MSEIENLAKNFEKSKIINDKSQSQQQMKQWETSDETDKRNLSDSANKQENPDPQELEEVGVLEKKIFDK